MDIVILGLVAVTLLFTIVSCIDSKKKEQELDFLRRELTDLKGQTDSLSKSAYCAVSEIKEILHQNQTESLKASSEAALNTNSYIMQLIKDFETSSIKRDGESNAKISEILNTLCKEILGSLDTLRKTNSEIQTSWMESFSKSMSDIRQMNERKLDEINKSVSDKLDKSLNERLDSSFKQIGEQLGTLYTTLGELNKLSTGVIDLNKTLSNVKTRGVWGETQLLAILENIMTPSQYETNISTKNNADKVEFAIKIPSKNDDNEFILLPIDSKFPMDIYNKIVDASDIGDSAATVSARKELEQRVKSEARTIRDKYLNPPVTTDFAIMFIPTESMYAEILRIDGLTDWCQNNCKIVISGPTTITALLNSLTVGFSNLAINRKAKDIAKILQAVKTQYSKLDELIVKTQKKLDEASSSTEELKKRTDMINKKMAKIETIDQSEADQILLIETK